MDFRTRFAGGRRRRVRSSRSVETTQRCGSLRSSATSVQPCLDHPPFPPAAARKVCFWDLKAGERRVKQNRNLKLICGGGEHVCLVTGPDEHHRCVGLVMVVVMMMVIKAKRRGKTPVLFPQRAKAPRHAMSGSIVDTFRSSFSSQQRNLSSSSPCTTIQVKTMCNVNVSGIRPARE